MALTQSDRDLIDRARQLAEAGDLEAIREVAGSDVDTYAEAYGVARVRLGDLLALVARLAADAGEADQS